MSDLFLVTGATGNVGRHVVSGLLNAGARVRALSRNPAFAGLPDQVEVIGGDLTIPQTLDGCLDGVDGVFLLMRSPSVLEAMPAFLDSAASHAKRIVFLSSSAVRDDIEPQTNPIAKIHADVERLIERSVLEWTFLRPGGFATNALTWWAPQIWVGDTIRWPYGAVSSAPIHERDMAEVAVRALLDGGHGGKKYVLTGPEALTQIEQVRILGEAIGRRLRFEEISSTAARDELAALMPSYIVEMLLTTWEKLQSAPALVTATVSEVTRSPARTFRTWAMDHAQDFRLAS